jgi:hypothetical protein
MNAGQFDTDGHVDEAHGVGCPARYGVGDCDEGRDLFIPVTIARADMFVLTAKGLEALGFPDLAAAQREGARARLAATFKRRIEEVDGTTHEVDYDSPAGAGHEVEADRG